MQRPEVKRSSILVTARAVLYNHRDWATIKKQAV